MNLERYKEAAGRAAAALVETGMTIGLGTGSTARYVTLEVGRRLREGELSDIRAVPTSEITAELARDAGIQLVELNEEALDLAIDGADEVAPGLDLIKGLGGALLREKIVASSAERFVVVADYSKQVRGLGEKFPLPLEVEPFGFKSTLAAVRTLGGDPSLRRKDGALVYSDNGHMIADVRFAFLGDPHALAVELGAIPGVLETGLFLGMTERAFLAGPGGVVALER